MIVPFQFKRQRIAPVLALAVAIIAMLLAALHPWAHLRAAALLLRMQNPQNPGTLARVIADSIGETSTDLPTPAGPIHARLYVPEGRPRSPGIVLVHGIHHLGIDEPRFVAFARALSSSGILVLTPELAPLADYRVDPASIDLIGYSARALSSRVGQKVAMLGLSFGGGLALIAATDPRFKPDIGFVVSVGAHDDLERVSQFLVTNRIQRPDGTTLEMPAHEYGTLVLIYSHLEDFFPPADVAAAREALRLLLWERVEASRKCAQQLSPDSRRKMELLFDRQVDGLTGELEAAIARHGAEMSPVSPHGHLGSLQVPILLLHGAADNVVPPTELLWLQQDVPANVLRSTLISPAISHVDMQGKPTLADNIRLVHFIAQIFELTDSTAPASSVPK